MFTAKNRNFFRLFKMKITLMQQTKASLEGLDNYFMKMQGTKYSNKILFNRDRD